MRVTLSNTPIKTVVIGESSNRPSYRITYSSENGYLLNRNGDFILDRNGNYIVTRNARVITDLSRKTVVIT